MSSLDVSALGTTGGGLPCRYGGCPTRFNPVIAPSFLNKLDKFREKFDMLSLADAVKRRNDHEVDTHRYHHSVLRTQTNAPFNQPDTDGFMPRRSAPI